MKYCDIGLIMDSISSNHVTGNFRVGDKVRVKASVTAPKYGWGDSSHKSVGLVKGTTCSLLCKWMTFNCDSRFIIN